MGLAYLLEMFLNWIHISSQNSKPGHGTEKRQRGGFLARNVIALRESFWHTGSLELFFWTSKKFKIQSFNFFLKVPGCSQVYILLLCKFIIRNTLYSVLGESNKTLGLGARIVSFFFSISRAYTTRYFMLKLCTIVVYTVGYIPGILFEFF
jgi:hypothetical protein